MDAIGEDGTFDGDSVRAASDIGPGYTYMRQGDVIRARVTPCFENLKGAWLSVLARGKGLGSTELFVFRPSDRIDPRFLYYVTVSDAFTEQGTATMYGAHGVRRVDDQFVRDFRVWLPSVGVQRAIVDYLDRETARIDGLIAAQRRLLHLLEERWQGVLEAKIRDLAKRCGEAPLKYMCREIVVGIVVTPAAWYASSGVPAIRGMNVSPGSISLDDLVYLTPYGHAMHPKSRLRRGDVVVVRTGQAGAAAAVSAEVEGMNCIDLVIVRPSRHYSPRFLELVFNSDWTQKHIVEHTVGTIQGHFNVGAARSMPVPQASLAEQRDAIAFLQVERESSSRLAVALKNQIGLLHERRRALITAAVSGQHEIPQAA